MRAIIIELFDYKGQIVKSILSDWPHFRTGDFILHKDIKYEIHTVINDITEPAVHVRAFARTS